MNDYPVKLSLRVLQQWKAQMDNMAEELALTRRAVRTLAAEIERQQAEAEMLAARIGVWAKTDMVDEDG